MEILLYLLVRGMATPLPFPHAALHPDFVLLSLGDQHLGYEFYLADPMEGILLKERQANPRAEQTDRRILNELTRVRTCLFGVDGPAQLIYRETVALNAIRARYLQRKEPCSILRGRVLLQESDRRLVNEIRAIQEPEQPCLL